MRPLVAGQFLRSRRSCEFLQIYREKGSVVGVFQGICADSWVRVEGPCAITCEVVGTEAQFRFGDSRSSGLDLIITEDALENVIAACMDALRQIRTPAETPATPGR
jgi:hypothetical protein